VRVSATQLSLKARRLGTEDPGPLVPLHVPRPVDRYAYIRQRCRGLRVLDLGAYDETEVAHEHHTSWRWLHSEIASVAAEVLGVDASDKVKQAGEIKTHCGTRIVYGTVERLDAIVAEFRPDLIVAGELIEHTPDTLGWIARLAALTPGTGFIATTPNTTSIVNILLAMLGRESCHPDHLQVYSFRTLATLSGRVPMSGVSIRPYFYEPHLFYGRVPRLAAPAVSVANAALRVVQRAVPLLSVGLILEGVLDGA
jgi:hypothetical protein